MPPPCPQPCPEITNVVTSTVVGLTACGLAPAGPSRAAARTARRTRRRLGIEGGRAGTFAKMTTVPVSRDLTEPRAVLLLVVAPVLATLDRLPPGPVVPVPRDRLVQSGLAEGVLRR